MNDCISESRTYVMLLTRSCEFQFIPFQVPDAIRNNAATAANLFQDQYLAITPINHAGRFITAIPIEQFSASLSQLGILQTLDAPQIPDLIVDLSQLLSSLYADAEFAADSGGNLGVDCFEAQLDAINHFCIKHKLSLDAP